MRHVMWKVSFETSKMLDMVSNRICRLAFASKGGINLRLFKVGNWIGNISHTLTDRRIDKLLGGIKNDA